MTGDQSQTNGAPASKPVLFFDIDNCLYPRKSQIQDLMAELIDNKVSVRLLTNAYKTHGQRVVKLLGIEDQFEGLTFCDYAEQPLTCKPAKAMYLKAMQHAGVERPEDCYFVDDSYQNCKAAQEYGWTAAHLVEERLSVPRTPASQYQIRHLQELRNIYPQFFKSASS
ncbi:hypothetical protein HYQ44_000591 [Verticillium longisporum]|nr:hypothetical protein HYQ44_000591 [Verticillium longisporum]